MEILKLILLVAAVIAVIDPLTHIFAESWYKNHPYAGKTAYFETLDLIYKHKYARLVSIITGIVCAVISMVI